MGREGGREGEEEVVEEEDLPQPLHRVQLGWQLPAGYGGLSRLRHGCGGVDDQPGYPGLVARMVKSKQVWVLKVQHLARSQT